MLNSFNPTGMLDVVYTPANLSIDVFPGCNMDIPRKHSPHASEAGRIADILYRDFISTQRLDVAALPEFTFKSNDTRLAGKGFVLVMVDPDSPTPEDTMLSNVSSLVNVKWYLGALISFVQSVELQLTDAIQVFRSTTPPTGASRSRSWEKLYSVTTC